jgi:hypothetical protein
MSVLCVLVSGVSLLNTFLLLLLLLCTCLPHALQQSIYQDVAGLLLLQ